MSDDHDTPSDAQGRTSERNPRSHTSERATRRHSQERDAAARLVTRPQLNQAVAVQQEAMNTLWDVARWVTCLLLLFGLATPFFAIGHAKSGSGGFEYIELQSPSDFHSILATGLGLTPEGDHYEVTVFGRVNLIVLIVLVCLIASMVTRIGPFADRKSLRPLVIVPTVGSTLIAWFVSPVHYGSRQSAAEYDRVANAHSYGLWVLLFALAVSFIVIGVQPDRES